MNIIFLDVDGVLNRVNKDISYGLKRPYTDYFYPFTDECLNNLKELVEKTNSYIVITSTWRYDEIGKSILLEVLRKYKIDNRIIGYTSILGNKHDEIKAYLDILDDNINYIIIDDDNTFKELSNHLIKTDFEIGLNKDNVLEGIKILTKR